MPPIENRAHIQEGSPRVIGVTSSHWGHLESLGLVSQATFFSAFSTSPKKLGLKPTYLKKGFFLLNYIGSFQEGGDVLIMAGCFQQEFQHGVPSRKNWERLRDQRPDWQKFNGLGTDMNRLSFNNLKPYLQWVAFLVGRLPNPPSGVPGGHRCPIWQHLTHHWRPPVPMEHWHRRSVEWRHHRKQVMRAGKSWPKWWKPAGRTVQ